MPAFREMLRARSGELILEFYRLFGPSQHDLEHFEHTLC